MQRNFRKYHRILGIIISLPLCLTVLTGMGYTIVKEWFDKRGAIPNILMGLHSGEIFHLEKIYPVLNAVGLLGLLITGLSMTSLFRSKGQSRSQG